MIRFARRLLDSLDALRNREAAEIYLVHILDAHPELDPGTLPSHDLVDFALCCQHRGVCLLCNAKSRQGAR